MAAGQVQVKDLVAHTQQRVARGDLVVRVLDLINSSVVGGAGGSV